MSGLRPRWLVMDLTRLDEALARWDEWDDDDHSIGERHPFYPAIQAARAYRDLLANGERVELVAGLLSTIDFQPSQHHPQLMVPWAEQIVRLLVDPPTEEER